MMTIIVVARGGRADAGRLRSWKRRIQSYRDRALLIFHCRGHSTAAYSYVEFETAISVLEVFSNFRNTDESSPIIAD